MDKDMKIHLGCGTKHIEGFINVDVRELDSVDVIDDVYLNKFNSDSIDLIYTCHVLEHIGRLEYKQVLLRWFNVLKDGGVLRLSVPDFEKIAHYYNTFKDLDKLRGFLYGGQTYKENYHYCTWDFNTLKKDLEDIGFKNVKRYDWKLTEHSSIDDYSQSYLPHMDKDNGMLMSLNIEATK